MKSYHLPLFILCLFFASSIDVCAQSYQEQLTELEKQKAQAVAATDYKLAGELHRKIEALKTKKPQFDPSSKTSELEARIKELEIQKAKAVEDANYRLAGELKAKIAKIKEERNSSTTSKPDNEALVQAEIKRLEKQKDAAVAAADFKLAGELKQRITKLKTDPEAFLEQAVGSSAGSTKLERLEKEKAEALSNKEYQKAGEINLEIIKLKNPPTGSQAPTRVANDNARTRISRSMENEMVGINYRRSSLYSIVRMTNGVEQVKYGDVIKEAFINFPIPNKFNDHNLDIRAIPPDAQLTNEVAKHLVAAWFNRDEQGRFDMELIKSRGLYNASSYDINVAQGSARGLRILEDAGEELLGNTFVIVNEFKYTDKEEVANKSKKGLAVLKFAGGFIPGAGGAITSTAATLGSTAATIAGKGYWIKNTCKLYQLVWNEQVANEFYNNYWVDEDNYAPDRVVAFDNSNLFQLKYIGEEISRADLQSSIFTSKSDEQLIAMATTKSVDKGIAKLERKFEQFRTKTPLFSVDPCTAKIGLKEGLEPGDKYEVLEQVQEDNGKLRYVRVGVISVDKHQIWDNTYSAEELIEMGKQPDQGNQFTVFRGSSPKFAPGMLIRQIN